MYSTINKQALKAIKTYVNNDVWHCYWHALSGDELKAQIFTVVHKPSDQMLSFCFSDLSSPYKLNEEQGIKDYLKEKFNVDANEIVSCVLQFLNDAQIEYLGKPFIKELA